jgi:hypothetical protein
VNRVTLLIVGLVLGAIVGYMTLPRPAVDINVGGVNIQVEGDKSGGSVTASGEGDGMKVAIGDRTSVFADPLWRTIIFAAIGGILGLVISALRGRKTA